MLASLVAHRLVILCHVGQECRGEPRSLSSRGHRPDVTWWRHLNNATIVTSGNEVKLTATAVQMLRDSYLHPSAQEQAWVRPLQPTAGRSLAVARAGSNEERKVELHGDGVRVNLEEILHKTKQDTRNELISLKLSLIHI